MGGDPTRKPMKIIHAFIDPIIENAISLRETGVNVEEHTFLDHLVKSDSGRFCHVLNSAAFKIQA